MVFSEIRDLYLIEYFTLVKFHKIQASAFRTSTKYERNLCV